MATSFTGLPPHSLVGWGLPFEITSTDTVTDWSTVVFRLQMQAPSSSQNFIDQDFATTGANLTITLGVTPPVANRTTAPLQVPSSDDMVLTQVYTWDTSTDTSISGHLANVTWDAQSGIPVLIQDVAGKGLTDAQSTELANSSDNSDTNLSLWDTFTSVTLPSLNDLINSIVTGITATVHTDAGDIPTTLATFFEQWGRNLLLQQEVTSGETCDAINADISHGTFFSLVLVITSYPDNWYFGGPGQTWGPADFAVLRITRGGNEVYRTGIHTTSYTVAPLPDVVIGPATFGQPVTPLDYHVLVDPAPGVCYQLYVEGLP